MNEQQGFLQAELRDKITGANDSLPQQLYFYLLEIKSASYFNLILMNWF